MIKSISSTGKSMFIDFKKPWVHKILLGIVEFEATIQFNKMDSDCQIWLDKNNILRTPINPNLSKDITCRWFFTTSFDSYISIDFSYIEVILTTKITNFNNQK